MSVRYKGSQYAQVYFQGAKYYYKQRGSSPLVVKAATVAELRATLRREHGIELVRRSSRPKPVMKAAVKAV